MKSVLFKGMMGVLAGLMLVLGTTGAARAEQMSAGTAAPSWGVPGTSFTFMASGFKGGPGNNPNKANATGEKLSYWLNAPDGSIISTRPLAKADDYGNTTTPLLSRANHKGEAVIRWVAPANALVGDYSIVIHGDGSGYEAVIPFTIAPNGAQAVTQTNVTPAAGGAGTTFSFVATGFSHGKDNGSGERVAYWINMPDGTIVSTRPLAKEDKFGNTTEPLTAHARKNGDVDISWQTPAGAMPGSYSMVVQGLSSQHQVVIPFSVR